MILGTEIDFSLLPPGRMDASEKFPKEKDDLHFGFVAGGPNPVVAEKQSFRLPHNTSIGTIGPLGSSRGNIPHVGPPQADAAKVASVPQLSSTSVGPQATFSPQVWHGYPHSQPLPKYGDTATTASSPKNQRVKAKKKSSRTKLSEKARKRGGQTITMQPSLTDHAKVITKWGKPVSLRYDETARTDDPTHVDDYDC